MLPQYRYVKPDRFPDGWARCIFQSSWIIGQGTEFRNVFMFISTKIFAGLLFNSRTYKQIRDLNNLTLLAVLLSLLYGINFFVICIDVIRLDRIS